MKESDLKRTVEDYLLTLEAQGKLWYERLQAGNILALQGEAKRRIRLCREGTADFIVIIGDNEKSSRMYVRDVIFLELKAQGKYINRAQMEFKVTVENQGAAYHVIKSLEDLQEVFD